MTKRASYPLRLESNVREWYEKEARNNGRSLQKELHRVLEEKMNRVNGAREKCIVQK